MLFSCNLNQLNLIKHVIWELKFYIHSNVEFELDNFILIFNRFLIVVMKNAIAWLDPSWEIHINDLFGLMSSIRFICNVSKNSPEIIELFSEYKFPK